VGKADGKIGQSQFSGAGSGAAVQVQERPAASVGADFDLAPAYAASTGAEGLHGRLFGGETDGELGRPAAGARLLGRRVDAVEETLAVAFEDSGDAGDFDEVDTGL
jgi:hypothetical protein